MLPPVLEMRPLYVEKLWGGARIAAVPAKLRPGHAPPPGPVGEAWEVADLPEGSSCVAGGPLAGVPLRALVQEHGRALAGARAREHAGVLRFPLLVKLIDARDQLSVQVHPGQAYARRHPAASPKDEAWLALHGPPACTVLHGLREGVGRAEAARALRDGRVDEVLRALPLARGDLLHVPPGTLHGIGAGCFLLEVQEPSDTTFRVWDYGRRDGAGQLRPVHVEQALEATSWETPPPTVVRAGAALETAAFSLATRALRSAEVLTIAKPREEPAVVHVVSGAVRLGHVPLVEGATALVTPGADVQAVAMGAALLAVMGTGAP